MLRIPLSVFIIAKNEADRIPFAIESVVDWTDEVIVVDSGSTDNTQEICEKMGARVLFHAWQGYGPQKVFAEAQCRHHWILNIDADEAVSPALAEEIQALFRDGHTPALPAYGFPITMMGRFASKPSRFAPSNDPIRLYDRRVAGFKDSLVHDSVAFRSGVKKQMGKLKHIALHRSFRSFAHTVEKINFYTDMQARDMFAKGRTPSPLRLVSEPLVAFLKIYFLRRFFLLGMQGFIESVITAFGKSLRLAKLWELHKEASLSRKKL